ncbi:GNAT family N-acetyltransferase [Cellulomonas composti]|nr:GNAT family N-acetyltransferase [Cellulomonas composti]
MATRTERLELRPFAPDDGAGIFGYLADPEAVRFEPYGVPTREECDALAADRAHDERFVAVCLRDGTLIGNLYRSVEGPPTWRTWEIGYVFGPRFWGHGYATEAAARLVRDLFEVEGAHRVVAACDVRNERSWRLLERLGMRREAHMLQAATFADDEHGRPVWHDSYHYAILEARDDAPTTTSPTHHFSDVIDRVEHEHERVTVTRNGRPR